MYNVSAAASTQAYSPMDTGEKPDINDIIQQLVAAVIPRPDEVFEPLTETWDVLLQMKSSADGITRKQKDRVESTLSATLEEVANNSLDALLLKDVVQSVLDPANWEPEQYLAKKAYESLCLSDLKLLEINEVEPNPRTFNSVLPSFAASTYDYGVLGRTLLWKGACQLFAGPSNAERSDKLRQAIFSFPNPPKLGKEKLEQLWEFIMAVDELGLDEQVDVEALRQQQNRP